MKATQSRIHCETPRDSWRPIVYLAAPVIAALIGLGAHAAYAACITPAGSQVTATGPFTLTYNTDQAQMTINCTAMVQFTPPDPSCTSADPICINADRVILFPCTGTLTPHPPKGGKGKVQLSATNGWQVCLSGDGMTSQLKIPQSGLLGVVAFAEEGAECRVTIPPNTFTSGLTVSGTWDNASSSMAFPTQTVPLGATGTTCTAGPTATISASLTTTPAITIN